MVVYCKWIPCCLRPSSFSPLVLGVPAGCVDRPSDMRGPPVTADRYIRSGAVQPNGVEVQLETKKGARAQKKKHGFLRSAISDSISFSNLCSVVQTMKQSFERMKFLPWNPPPGSQEPIYERCAHPPSSFGDWSVPGAGEALFYRPAECSRHSSILNTRTRRASLSDRGE